MEKQLVEIRDILERIYWCLRAKSAREWLIDYYDSISKIPDYFTAEEWEETEKEIYDNIVREVNENFSARGIHRSGVREKVLGVLEKERRKLLKAKIRK